MTETILPSELQLFSPHADADEALRAALWAITDDPEHGDAYLALAAAADGDNQFDESREVRQELSELRVDVARTYLRINQRSAEAHFELGDALFWAEHFSEAETSYGAARRLGLENSAIHFAMARVLSLLGRHEEGAGFFQKIVATMPTDIQNYENFVGVFGGDILPVDLRYKIAKPSSRWREIYKSYKSRYSSEPSKSAAEFNKRATKAEGYSKIGRTYYNFGNAQPERSPETDTIKNPRKKIDIYLSAGEFYYRLGRLYVWIGHITLGVAALRIAVKLPQGGIGPHTSEAYYTLGLALAATGRLEKAISAFAGADKIAKAFPDMYSGAELNAQGAENTLKVLLFVERIRSSLYKEEMEGIEDNITELSKLTGVPANSIREFIENFKITATENTSPSTTGAQDDVEPEAKASTQTSDELNPPVFAVPPALMSKRLDKRVRTQERVFTEQAVRDAQALVNAYKTRKKRGAPPDLTTEEMAAVRDARSYVRAWERLQKMTPT